MARTWVSEVENFSWYSSEHDAILNPHVVSYPGGNDYTKVTCRVLMVWQHVWRTYRGYDWYVRVFDDAYVFPKRLEQVVQGLDPSQGILLGRNGIFNGQRYVGGGSPWVVSRAALEAWFGSQENPDAMFKKYDKSACANSHPEDAWISIAM